VSERIAEHLVRAGMRPGQVEVKVNPVPDPGAATSLGSGFAYVGRLREEKGAHLLLEAWERSGLGRSTTLTIAGDGPDRRRVEATASRLQGVTYVGGVAREEALELMRRCAVVVVPSLWEEPAGLATIEAHALGRPVVATTLGATPGYVDASSSWVVEPSATDLAGGLVQAAREVGEGHGSAARAHYEACFSPTVTMERQLTLYRQLLAHDRESGA
jgi:glycosyltransferase involved in cell wall biosynthesis